MKCVHRTNLFAQRNLRAYFLLIGRWLPNAKKKKNKVLHPNTCIWSPMNYYANYSSLCTAIGAHILGQICWTMAEYATVPVEELSLLMKKLQKSLPDTLPIYYTADNTVRGRLSLEEVQFYVNSWPDPTCVVLVSPAQHGKLFNYRTTVDMWAEDSSLAVKFLCNNTILDWHQPIFFRVQPLSESEFRAVQAAFEEKLGTYSCVKRHIYTLGSSPPQAKEPPPGYILCRSLSQGDAETVGHQYSAWGVAPSDTIRYFQACSTRLPSSGIHTANGELVSYVVLHHTSAFGSVVTDPQHQRKGLGAAVVADICWKMVKDKQTPYVFVNPENVASARLYAKCGFEFKAVAYRIRYTPKS